MRLELLIALTVFAFYMAFEQGQYKASWRVHLFGILFPIFILKYVKDLDPRARMFILVVLIWHVIDCLNHAIDDGYKNDLDYKCTHTASISNTETTEEKPSQRSLNGKDSMSSFSEQQTDEKSPLQDSTSVSPNTDAP